MKTFPELPEAITREQVLAAVAALGLKPEEIRSVKIGTEYVEVECFARQGSGERVMLRSDRDEPATHVICYIVRHTPTVADG